MAHLTSKKETENKEFFTLTAITYTVNKPRPSYVLMKLPWRNFPVLLKRKWGAESSLSVAHPGYQVLSDILFRLGLIANALTQCSS